jgi:hypothetical protein
VTELIISNKVSGFDYAALPADTTEILQSTVLRIRERLKASIIETGRDLLSIKNMVEPRTFGRWLEVEFGMTVRTAQNYMAAAELVAEYETVSHLPTTTLYRLASAPDPVRVAMVERLDKGETVSKSDISDAVWQHRHAEAEAQRIARTPPAKLKRERTTKERREREREARRLEYEKAEQEERTAARRAIAILRERLDENQFKEFVTLVLASSYRFRGELEKVINPDAARPAWKSTFSFDGAEQLEIGAGQR